MALDPDTSHRDRATAYLLLRFTLGLNICIHGVSRLLNGPASFAHTLVPMFQHTLLPGWSVLAFGLLLPWCEAILGMFLLLGFRTRFALIGGGLLLAVLTFGTTLRQDWSSAGVQLLYAGIYAALLACRSANLYSVDTVLRRQA